MKAVGGIGGRLVIVDKNGKDDVEQAVNLQPDEADFEAPAVTTQAPRPTDIALDGRVAALGPNAKENHDRLRSGALGEWHDNVLFNVDGEWVQTYHGRYA